MIVFGRRLLTTLPKSEAIAMASASTGPRQPLQGVDVIELEGLAPVPFCGMVLADYGANVTVVKRGGYNFAEKVALKRGKSELYADLKSKEGIQNVRELCKKSDVLLDPYRPGVLERLGLDPVELLNENEKLVVARVTGYGQYGCMSEAAGHDINYVSTSGLLPTIAGHSPARKPYWTPANLLADFGGGGLSAAFGVVTALFQRTHNGGKGAIIDVSMVDGLAYLGSFINYTKHLDPFWNVPYAAFSGDCPIYRTYETADGKFVAVGPLEDKLQTNFFKALKLDVTLKEVIKDPKPIVEELEAIFKTKTRDEWAQFFKEVDACVTAVLDIDEAPHHQYHKERETFRQEGNTWMPRPAPRIYSKEAFKKLMQEKSK